MPSRWEVILAGAADAAIPLTAPHAVVSRWLDDPAPGVSGGSGHGDPVKKWACGPLRALGPGPGIALEVRLLDDTLAGRLQAATTPGTAVQLGSCQYRVQAPARIQAACPRRCDEGACNQTPFPLATAPPARVGSETKSRHQVPRIRQRDPRGRVLVRTGD